MNACVHANRVPATRASDDRRLTLATLTSDERRRLILEAVRKLGGVSPASRRLRVSRSTLSTYLGAVCRAGTSVLVESRAHALGWLRREVASETPPAERPQCGEDAP